MEITNKNIAKIAFLQADIERLDEIIRQHAVYQNEEDSLFMMEQYEHRRRKLYRQLCIELLSLPFESSINFSDIAHNITNLYHQNGLLPSNITKKFGTWANR